MIRMKLHIKMAEIKITQKELSQLTGIRQPTISAYCNEKYTMIPKEHLDILCKFFSCSIENILEYIDDDILNY